MPVPRREQTRNRPTEGASGVRDEGAGAIGKKFSAIPRVSNFERVSMQDARFSVSSIRQAARFAICGFHPMETGLAASYHVIMTKNGDDEPAHRSDRDLKKFEKQPDERKELQRLKDTSEKAAGPEKATLDREIRRRADSGTK